MTDTAPTTSTIQQPLPWQQGAWRQLVRAQRSGRLAHAYLLQARPGSGRRQFAEALASWLFCEHVDSHDTACGQCRQCQLQRDSQHPDLLVVTPEAGSKSIKIDYIRQMGEFIQQTSHQSETPKVVLLYPAEAMGVAAANSLLKNLEEPPGRSLFLLLTDSSSYLLPTLRSRCQPLSLGEADTEQALHWLTQHTSAEEDDLRQALAMAPGSPLLALQLLEQGIPTWHGVLTDHMLDMEEGRLSPLEVARHCEKLGGQSVVSYAIQFMQARISSRVRQQLDRQPEHAAAALRLLADHHRVLQEVNQRLVSGANPNVLMNLDYLLSSWLTCHRALVKI